MLKRIVLFLLAAPLWLAAAESPGVFDVRTFGAKADGSVVATKAINDAVEACSSAGGGQVLFSAGRYLSGTIRLKSNVTLYFAAGATLVGTTNLEDYSFFRPPPGVPEARFKPEWHRALILAIDTENIGIQGPGVIDGNKVFDPRGEERMRGPHAILFGHCHDITIRDVSVKDAANYGIMLEDCSNVEVRGVRVTGGWDGVHFRGWPDSYCKNVSIIGCQFYTGDDAIAGRYWDNVLISQCVLNSSCNGIRLIGPANHLIIHDCLFYGPGAYPHRSSKRSNMLAAIALQPGAWDATHGLLDDVLISNLTIRNVTTPFHFSVKGDNTVGKVLVERVSASNAYLTASSIESWNDTPLTNVTFRDVTIEYTGGGTAEEAKAEVRSPGVDARRLPTWGFFGRNVESLIFDNVRLRTIKEDLRPAFLMENVKTLTFRDIDLPHSTNLPETMVLKNVEKVERESGKMK